MKTTKLSAVETVKSQSNYLRGSIKQSLKDNLTGSIVESDQQLIKFHGSYQQDDRDIRSRRVKKKLEPAYSFMIRLRIPAGRISAEQMFNLFEITDKNATGVVKITTRQTVQLHGVIKSKLKPTIQFFDKWDLDSIAACGDINRNVVLTSNFTKDSFVSQKLYPVLVKFTKKISEKFLPQGGAYQEIWLNKSKILEKKDNVEPIYGAQYLPRKFKIAIAIPPFNDVDVYANDIGLVAIVEKEKLIGFNIMAGGGMGTTHGNEATYPRLGSLLGFVSTNRVMDLLEAIITFQRDNGNRTDRKLARLKYTIDNFGLEAFKLNIEKRSGVLFKPAKDFQLNYRSDLLGFRQDPNNNWHYTVFIENGRIVDKNQIKLKTVLKEIASLKISVFQFTTNQNITISDIKPDNKSKIEAILDKYGISDYQNDLSSIRENSMACVALNTCPLALAEGQRYLPSLISKIEPILTKYNLSNENITIRMTGCPNGCARPYLAEIAMVGTAMGKYNLYLGGDRSGSRLNQKYKESLGEAEILQELDKLFNLYSQQTLIKNFGDFIYEKKLLKNATN